MKVSNKKRLVFFILIVSIIAILVPVLLNLPDVYDDIDWNLPIQVCIDLIIILIVSFIIEKINSEIATLDNMYAEIELLNNKGNKNSLDLFEKIKKYYKRGGEKETKLNDRTLYGAEANDIPYFKCRLIRCYFKKNPPNEKTVVVKQVISVKFLSDLITVGFYDYKLSEVTFTEHNYALTFRGCNLENLCFDNSEVVEGNFFLDPLIVDNLSFRKTYVSSTRFISTIRPTFRDYNEDKETPEEYLDSIKRSYTDTHEWYNKIKFNSSTELNRVTMSFDIYLSLYFHDKNFFDKVEIHPFNFTVIVDKE